MTDFNLGVQVDTSSVATGKERLTAFKQAAVDTATATRAMQASLADMARQQQQTNDLLRSHGQTLQDIDGKTSGYINTLAKLATVGTALYAAYSGLNLAVHLATAGMEEQVTVVGKVSAGFRDLARYGTDAFTFMSSQSVAAEKAISAIGAAVSSTGAQFKIFAQQLSSFGIDPTRMSNVFTTLGANLTTMTPQATQARNILQSYGVQSTNPVEAAQQFIEAMKRVQNSPEKNAQAGAVLGPEGPGIVNDTITGLRTVTELQRSLGQLQEQNARNELEAAERRRQDDEQHEHQMQTTPFVSLFNPTQQAAGAAVATSTNRSFLDAFWNQPLSGTSLGNMGSAIGTQGKALWSMLTGGDTAALALKTNLGNAETPPLTALDYAKGAGDLAVGGAGSPQEALLGYASAVDQLNDDLRKGKIDLGSYDVAITNLGNSALAIADRAGSIMRGEQFKTSIGDFGAIGQQRSAEEYLRAIAPSVTGIAQPEAARNAMTGEQVERFSQQWINEEKQRRLTAAAPVYGEILAGEAGASAAENGPYAARQAEIAEKYRQAQLLNPSMAAENAMDRGFAQRQLDLPYTRAQGEFAFQTTNAAATAHLQAQNLFGAINTGGPLTNMQSILLGARARARRANPNLDLTDDEGNTDFTQPAVQTQVLAASTDAQESVKQRVTMMTNMVDQQQKGLQALHADNGDMGGGASALFQMRQQMGIAQAIQEMQANVDAMTTARGAGGEDSLIPQSAIDDAKKYIDVLSSLSEKLVEFAKERRVAVAEGQINKQINTTQAQIDVLAGGGSIRDLEIARRAEALHASGVPMNGGPAAGAQGPVMPGAIDQATVSIDREHVLKQMTSDMTDFNEAASKGVDILLNGFEGLATRTGTWQNSLKEIGLQLSKLGEQLFINKPIENALNNWTGGWGNGGTGGGGAPYAAGGGSSSGGSTFGSALASLGPLGKAAGSLYDSLFGGASAAAGDAAAGLSGPLGDSFAGTFGAIGSGIYHSGGLVGSSTARRDVNAGVFHGAPRMHAGGLLPDEIPIIAQRGERVLNREQTQNYGRGNVVNMQSNIHIHTPDTTGFRRSASQIASQQSSDLGRLARRIS